MFKFNPYRPGAGTMPAYLAGRDDIISEVSDMFDYMNMGIPGQSIVFSGLRGVGKTVLINKLFSIGEQKGFYCKHIEVESQNDFAAQIITCSKNYLQKHSAKTKIKSIFDKTIGILKSFQISFCPEDGSFTLSQQDKFLYESTSLTQSMTDLFCALGEVAQSTETPICLFIDEIQCMKKNELASLITSIHRANQLGYPIIIIAAGLPKIYKMLSDEKSYSERLFIFKEIASLTEEQAKKAIIEPVKKMGVLYDTDSIKEIYKITKGYPFFIQQFCSIIYKNLDSNNITESTVKNNIEEFLSILDSGFFKVRYEKCSRAEKDFLFAMVKCGELPCTISNVAKNLNKETTAISPTRGQLMNKGLIYSVRYSELDFTVPEFDGFIKRRDEYVQWCLSE